MPGTRLGAYEIVALLGSGGMGEVYRARDTRLGRDVAIKVLPDTFSSDPERLARFQREAEVLASLNHPNIGGIYGLEEGPAEAGRHARALVLELVEGPTLADRIAQGPIPMDEALPLARQIAEALEAAHEKGIIHRDLKPANIKVRPDGTVKVLDFGLAKLAESPAASVTNAALMSQSPTITTPAMMTGIGMILGTAAYMSPEQAKGRPADKRSDVWAFGCVLYEMLTGKRVFEGEDVSETLAAVLRDAPDWSAIPSGVPLPVHVLLKACLDRDPRQRVGDSAAVLFVLRRLASITPTAHGGAPVRTARAGRWRRVTTLGAVAAAIAAFGLFMGRSLAPAAERRVTRFTIALPEGQQFTEVGGQIIAISSDGSHLAYIANQRVYHRAMSELESHPVAGTEGKDGERSTNVMFSPDGEFIGFWMARQSVGPLKKVALGGGTPVPFGQFSTAIDTIWRDTGILVGQREKGIIQVSPNGQQTLLAKVPDGMVARPQILPDGDTLLFAVTPGVTDPAGAPPDTWDKAKIVVQSLKSGERTTVLEGGGAPTYVATGHLVYAVGGTLFAAPFDYRRRTMIGGALAVVEGVARPQFAMAAPPTVYYRVADNGTLVYVPGPALAVAGQFDLATIDATGRIERLNLRPTAYLFPRVSPDGKHVAFGTDDGKEANVWTYDFAGASEMRQLTVRGKNRYPVWSGDGERIAYQSDRDGDLGIFVQRADGNSPPERLTTAAPGTAHVPESWSNDGRTLLFSEVKNGNYELWALSVSDKRPTRFGDVKSSIDPTAAVFSPDGRWVVYLSTDNGKRTVFIEPFPSTGVKHPLGSDVFHPVWSRDGTRLFYRAAGARQFAVRVTTQPAFSLGRAEALAGTGFQSRGRVEREYDVTPDGRFVGIVAADQRHGTGGPDDVGTRQQINVVLNWTEELKQRVPTR